MLRQGVHPKIVQERLRHAKVGTTLDIHSHVPPGLQEAAALRFDDRLAGAKEPERREVAAQRSIGVKIGTVDAKQ